MTEENKKEDQSKKKSIPLSIPVVKVPNETEFLEEELQEMFDEDKVTHKHGDSQPESD